MLPESRNFSHKASSQEKDSLKKLRQSPLDKIEINADERENKSTDSDCDKDVKQAPIKPQIPKISWPIAHEEYSAAAMREETDDNE